MEETPKANSRRNKIIGLAVILLLLGLYIWWVEDWYQLWKITSAPDNIPIVAMLFLVPFFTWLGVKQAVANDQLINQLEADPKLAKSHHRKAEPWRPGRSEEHTSELQSLAYLVCRLLLEKKKQTNYKGTDDTHNQLSKRRHSS